MNNPPVPFYRYYNPVLNDHFYSTEKLAESSPWRFELVACYLYQLPADGTLPLYRYWNGHDHFYTTDFSTLGPGKNGYFFELIAGYIFPTQPSTQTVPLYRAFNVQTGNHFYTTDPLDVSPPGYKAEGIAGYVYRA